MNRNVTRWELRRTKTRAPVDPPHYSRLNASMSPVFPTRQWTYGCTDPSDARSGRHVTDPVRLSTILSWVVAEGSPSRWIQVSEIELPLPALPEITSSGLTALSRWIGANRVLLCVWDAGAASLWDWPDLPPGPSNPPGNEGLEGLVLHALEDDSYDFRTAAGIAAETRLPEREVVHILENNIPERVRLALIPRPQGKEWYAPRTRPPSKRERRWRWRAALAARPFGS